jgi:hypothetical protein
MRLENIVEIEKAQIVPTERKCNRHFSYPQHVPLEQIQSKPKG